MKKLMMSLVALMASCVVLTKDPSIPKLLGKLLGKQFAGRKLKLLTTN